MRLTRFSDEKHQRRQLAWDRWLSNHPRPLIELFLHAFLQPCLFLPHDPQSIALKPQFACLEGRALTGKGPFDRSTIGSVPFQGLVEENFLLAKLHRVLPSLLPRRNCLMERRDPFESHLWEGNAPAFLQRELGERRDGSFEHILDPCSIGILLLFYPVLFLVTAGAPLGTVSRKTWRSRQTIQPVGPTREFQLPVHPRKVGRRPIVLDLHDNFPRTASVRGQEACFHSFHGLLGSFVDVGSHVSGCRHEILPTFRTVGVATELGGSLNIR